jgi:hypothetical protein
MFGARAPPVRRRPAHVRLAAPCPRLRTGKSRCRSLVPLRPPAMSELRSRPRRDRSPRAWSSRPFPGRNSQKRMAGPSQAAWRPASQVRHAGRTGPIVRLSQVRPSPARRGSRRGGPGLGSRRRTGRAGTSAVAGRGAAESRGPGPCRPHQRPPCPATARADPDRRSAGRNHRLAGRNHCSAGRNHCSAGHDRRSAGRGRRLAGRGEAHACCRSRAKTPTTRRLRWPRAGRPESPPGGCPTRRRDGRACGRQADPRRRREGCAFRERIALGRRVSLVAGFWAAARGACAGPGRGSL